MVESAVAVWVFSVQVTFVGAWNLTAKRMCSV
jgi:hypothetical protein